MGRALMLICPQSGEEVSSLKIWRSQLPDGRVIHYGQLHQHSHWGQECEWSYLVQPAIECGEQFTPVYI